MLYKLYIMIPIILTNSDMMLLFYLFVYSPFIVFFITAALRFFNADDDGAIPDLITMPAIMEYSIVVGTDMSVAWPLTRMHCCAVGLLTWAGSGDHRYCIQ